MVSSVEITIALPTAPLLSLDYLVGDGKELRRHVKIEGPSGLEIDDELNLVGWSTGRSAGFCP